MEFDVEDMLAGTFGRIVGTFLFLVSAIWVGSMIGGLAWVVSYWSFSAWSSVRDILDLWASPMLLVNLWMVPNVAFLAATVVYLLVSENTGYLTWGIVVGVESLFVLLGETFGYGASRNVIWAWSAWLVFLAFAESGVWYLSAMRKNRWARQMEELKIENAMRRAERDLMAKQTPPESAGNEAG